MGDFIDATGQHGFLKDGATFTTIDVPGATSTVAHGVNDAGQIVGQFLLSDPLHPHGFVATPVPEPATWLLFGASLVVPIWWRKIIHSRNRCFSK